MQQLHCYSITSFVSPACVTRLNSFFGWGCLDLVRDLVEWLQLARAIMIKNPFLDPYWVELQINMREPEIEEESSKKGKNGVFTNFLIEESLPKLRISISVDSFRFVQSPSRRCLGAKKRGLC